MTTCEFIVDRFLSESIALQILHMSYMNMLTFMNRGLTQCMIIKFRKAKIFVFSY